MTAHDTAWRFHAHPEGRVLDVRLEGTALKVTPLDGDRHGSTWALRAQPGTPRLEWLGACAGEPDEAHLLAAIEAAFQRHPAARQLALQSPLPTGTRLVDAGIVTPAEGALPTVAREAFWQWPRAWLPQPREPFAQRFVVTQGKRHPLRPAKPQGTVYRRHIPWLNQTLTLDTVDIERDLPAFHRWMNDPVVAHFWEEEGDLARHRQYLEGIAADPRVTGLVGRFDGEPFGYFEAYWAKEDRIAPFYDAADHDRGWHALVGEARFRGKPFLTAWMPSVSHYLFLDDPRTQRLVIEPRADNEKMIRSLGRCGYAHVKEFDFPHKRALLGVLWRERFFGEALWIPRADPTAASPAPARRHEPSLEDIHANP
ncbi:GNAT family N-acetyltransferase [Variovorax boronicumulans]|uniref:GNAT family N-acetyltransferase n=1 Tax=Variovorax boronicumulans TaxID=436515 RepID=UPI0036F39232